MRDLNTNSIAILMATYNGEKFLRSQIDSIINQSFKNWTLYIQDDGSSDSTIDIITEYCVNDNRIKLLDTGLSRQGASMNFMSMLNVVESDYYMFCDQDDVWFPDKIKKSIARIKDEERLYPDKPIIVHTDRTHTDGNLNILLKSEFNPRNLPEDRISKKINRLKHPDILRIYTIVGGCTMLFNHKVKEIVFPYINVRVHDSVCAMAVANNGGIISTILEPTMYYRLHGNNTCGVSSSRIAPKLLRLFSTLSSNLRGFYIWKIYGGGNFISFCYWRIRYFLILRLN